MGGCPNFIKKMIKDTFINDETRDKILETAKLEAIVSDFLVLTKKGTSLKADCPKCGGKQKMSFSPKKDIFKCYTCDTGGKGAVAFLQKCQGKTFFEALHYCADHYNILIESDKPRPKKKRKGRKQSFRDQQLRASGITAKAQRYFQKYSNKQVEQNRYESGTIDKFWNVIDGDDMILNYVGFDRNPITYRTPKGKERPLIRIRWQNPLLHLDKKGNSHKYKSPYGSGSHLWIPEYIIRAYEIGKIIDTLYICEGEKKADKLCMHDIAAVAVMGINNFANEGNMPHHFEQLIKKCGIKNVVFLLDSDWQDISAKRHKAVDARPNLFFKAVLKFRDYFYAYNNSGIELGIYFGYGKDKVLKGVDDLLVHTFKQKEAELKADLEKSRIDRQGEGEYINIHNITTLSEYKLKEFWHLNSATAFLDAHRQELLEIKEFTLRKQKRRFNEDGELELVDKLLPHEQYWIEEEYENSKGITKKRITFDYYQINIFLRNRGFGLMEGPNNTYKFINLENKIVREVTAHQIQRFVQDFTNEINQLNVLRMILKGGSQYLGPDKLSNMQYIKPQFLEADRNTQYLYFKNCFWKITADEVVQRPLSELPGNIWKDKIIDFDPKKLDKPMVEVKRVGDKWEVNQTKESAKSDIQKFFIATSNFYWKKRQELFKDEKGNYSYIPKEKPEYLEPSERDAIYEHYVAKMLAAGHMLHEYRDLANMKAVISMDGLESEVGKSEGGSGKSIFSTMFEHLVPTHVIDAKQKNLSEDKFLYEGVDERTSCIVFDDARVNFDFEFLFSQITRGLTVNKKGLAKFTIDPPKFIINTNHAPNGYGNSYERRRYLLGFSDYYNAHRTPQDDFGRLMFKDWDYEQWNLFYNFMANCIQTFLKYRLDYTVPQGDLKRRKLRQEIGENILDWANLFFSKTDYLNNKVLKNIMYDDFMLNYPQDRRYITLRKFKNKIKKYAQYMGYEWNPLTEGGDIKSNGKEYFILANKEYDSSNLQIINMLRVNLEANVNE